MIRKGVIVGIIFLFFFTSLQLISVGSQSNWNDKYAFPQWYNSSNSYYSQNYNTTQSNAGIILAESTYEKTFGMENSIMNSSWPMHGYDIYHTGRSPYNTTDNFGVEKWRFAAGDYVDGSAVIDQNGIIYFGAMSNFYAVYPNGTQKWHTIFGSSICMFGTSSAIDENGIIYVPTMSGLVAVYSNNGTVKWSYGGDVEASPVIGVDGTVYFGLTSGNNGYIIATYPNGTIHWRYQTGLVVYSSPAIGLDGTVYCGSHDGNLYALNPNNGTLKWSFGTGGWVHGAPTVAADGTVYIGSDSTYLYALYPNNGTMKWRVGVGSMRTSPSLDKNGILYFGVWEHRFYAVYPNGTIKWSYYPGNDSGTWGSTAAISNEGMIYFTISNKIDIGPGFGGDIIAVNLNGTEIWRKRIAGDTFCSPCISNDGSVYIGGSSYLHAFGPGEQKNFKITTPQQGHFYLFGKDMGITPKGNTIVVGSITIQLQINSGDEIEGGVSFILGNAFCHYNQYTSTEPPYEWKMDKRYGATPFVFNHDLTVCANYKGGCQWSETIQFWYLHFRKN